jgi:hypothetical protein
VHYRFAFFGLLFLATFLAVFALPSLNAEDCLDFLGLLDFFAADFLPDFFPVFIATFGAVCFAAVFVFFFAITTVAIPMGDIGPGNGIS